MLKGYFAQTNIGVFVFGLVIAFVSHAFASHKASELGRWEQQASNVQIVRDDWGIAHVTGKTDADAVFGSIYAQAEDDFNRIETNYLNSMGRLAEAEGEKAICARKCSSIPPC